MQNKIIIAGGTGFIGQKLTSFFKRSKFDVVILTRKKTETKNGIQYIHWNAKDLDSWQNELENATALINLTGKSINCLFTKKNKEIILTSRINATKVLNEAINLCKNPPKIFINASGISIYKSVYHTNFTENNFDYGNDFLANVTKQWEDAFYSILTPKTRKVAIRIAPVLDKDSQAIKTLIPVIKLGLGGKQGNGKQLFPFIHSHDFVQAINFVIKNESIRESVNLIAPTACTNAQFMQTFRKKLNIKIGLPTPAFALHLGKYFSKVEPEVILTSLYAQPNKLLKNGFKFKHNTIDSALNEIVTKQN